MPSIRREGHIRLMDVHDLELVLGWRNHPDIRTAMTTQHEISLDEHQEWFEKSRTNTHRTLLIYERHEALGYANLEESYPGIFAWGFYAAPDAPKGTGRALCREVLGYAFEQKVAHKVSGQVLAGNEKSIRLHQALGFRSEGTLREHCLIGSTYHDLICFGLLKAEWVAGN
ncbi:MAG: UDP-4-amino-4,6-dideoxy-N-acetyl-beta-L-altrosamine N-acetyltransferase [Bordetella sp.]|uniref:UDP-4-amino-4, 6-dideoxy-N-acetyl-beta-L-altrosamine N-acetyltransferase n=1 Tax=Bordetella sp. TaxID=28081 RepID=UPI003F7C2878